MPPPVTPICSNSFPSGVMCRTVWSQNRRGIAPDDWADLPNRRDELTASDVYTLRRITPDDRGGWKKCA